MNKASIAKIGTGWIFIASLLMLLSLFPLLLHASVSSPDTRFNCTPQELAGLEQRVRDIPHGSQHYQENMFMVGEEFEFWIDEPVVPASLEVKKKFHTSNVHASIHYVTDWAQAVTDKALAMGIKDFRIEIPPVKDEHKSFSDITWAKIRIGNWHSVVYLEEWFAQDRSALLAMLEVNVSPYTLHKKFTVDGKSYSVYTLLDNFVLSIAEDLKLRAASGHKHLDLVDSIAGNQELMFRMLVDVENKAWLSRFWGCEHDSGLSGESFVYRIQDAINPGSSSKLQAMVDSFNEGLQLSHPPGKNTFTAPRKTLQRLMNIWRCQLGGTHLLPAEIRMNSYGDPTRVSNQRAKQGEPVQHPLSGTLELRFLPAGRTDEEVYRINQLLVHWFRYLADQQKARLPIEYLPNDPLSRDIPPQQLKAMFLEFIQQIGLNPEHYKTFERQGCERSHYDLYGI